MPPPPPPPPPPPVAPLPIKLQIPREPIKTANPEDQHRQLQLAYNDINRLKAEIDTLKQRLFTAGIP